MAKASPIRLVHSELSDPDGRVLRAIGMGSETRAQIKDRTELSYDLIEKAIERHSLDLQVNWSGSIDTIRLKTPLSDKEKELARYEVFEAKALAQNITPLTFEEWQPRFGGPTDEITLPPEPERVSEEEPTTEEIAPLPELAAVEPQSQVINAPEQRPDPYVPLPDDELAKLNPADFVRRFNTFDEFEIDRFFEIMNERKDGVIWGCLEDNREIADFYPRAYYVLIKLLSPHMTEEQKEAVWTLILYVNKEHKG